MFLREFFKKYVKDTPEKAVVADHKMALCYLTRAVMRGIYMDDSAKNVYITSRCVKHWFDKKPAEEFFFLIDNLHKIVKYPNKIYKNRKSKRGDFCFLKKIGNEEYICSVEILEFPPAVCGMAEFGASQLGTESIIKEIQVATAFRLRDEKYIKNYTLLWDWGNGNPHRSALDTHKESTNAPQ
jgi:hypothetical protein